MVRSSFIIAATSSGCGKTTLSLGLMRALVRRDISVQPFKCGPDYIDTLFHGKASGSQSINLDLFMSSEDHVKSLFQKYSAGKEVSVVEGVMGMFDGYSKMKGSSAELSLLLSIPVVLLINAASTAYSVAATIYGFKNFNPQIKLAGVIFNKVSSPSHFSFLKDACEDAGVECLGYIRKDSSLATPSRHLGLTLTAEREMEDFINTAADAVEENVDIDKLLQQTADHRRFEDPMIESGEGGKIAAVACDEAFNFIYPENLESLKRAGYEIRKFSPLLDHEVPDADFVYLPGGYPELYAGDLASNLEMKESIRRYVEEGGKLWAECGGLIYLTRQIDGMEMCGIFDLKCTMQNAKLTLGYRTVDFGDKVFKGHEFHYSTMETPDALPSVAIQSNIKGKYVDTPVYRYKNLLASYTHLYWGDKDLLDIWKL